MAEEKSSKKTPLTLFREKISEKSKLSQHLTEGFQSTNAKVRALAAKIALRTQDSAFIKKSIHPLMTSDKSKKVLRVISKYHHRKTLAKRLAEMKSMKPAPKKETEAPKA